jgi:Tfp pilus assembly protein PilX
MLIAVMMLVLMGLLGLAALETAGQDQQIAGLSNRSRSAFHAAEAGAAHGRQLVAAADGRGAVPALPNTTLGDATLYARYQAQPSYFPDPNPPGGGTAIQYVEDGGPAEGMNLANPRYVTTIWRINVVGQSPENAGGVWEQRASTARVEVMESKVLSSGY